MVTQNLDSSFSDPSRHRNIIRESLAASLKVPEFQRVAVGKRLQFEKKIPRLMIHDGNVDW